MKTWSLLLKRFTTAPLFTLLPLFAGCMPAHSAPAQPSADQQTEYTVEVYTQDGRTVGCQLSFLVSAPVDAGQAVYAIAGDLEHYEYDGKEWNAFRLKSAVNVARRSSPGIQRIPLVMGWLDNAGPHSAKNTLSYMPLPSADETAPMWKHYIWNYKPEVGGNGGDPGLTQLMNAAMNGFTLLLRVQDTPLDEPIGMPRAPLDVQKRLLDCLDKQGHDAAAANKH